MTERMVVVPHTHWDREWYEPFQVFRLKLVEMLDDVLARAEADPAFRFTLDGQSAAIEDYLAIRPENTDRVRALVERRQLALGPFLILLDEFLCSGETIVRNLELGWRRAESLGRAMPVGHLPDMFGHTAQMPQILARSGIADAAMWRGVPGHVDKHAFRWEAPDGSAVRVQYLFDGYGNALDVFALPARLDQAIDDYRAETAQWYGDDPVLGMLGSDHTAPRPDLEALVRDRDGVVLATLDEYVARYGGATDGLPVVHGEMRSHARGNILPGVTSIRVGLKAAMAGAERMLATAEAVLALGDHSAAQTYQPFLDLAWHQVVESTAHDSVTGCGVDATADTVASRLAEATHIARAVRDRGVARLAGQVPSDAFVLVNSLPTFRYATVELTAAVDDDVASVVAEMSDGDVIMQEIGRMPDVLGDETLPAGHLDRVVRRIHGRELFGQQIDEYTVSPGELEVLVAEVPTTPEFDLAAFRAALAADAKAHGEGGWNVVTRARPRRRFVASVPLPPSGVVPLRVIEAEPRPTDAAPAFTWVTVGERSLTSGLIGVHVDDDGTLTVTGGDGTVVSGIGRLVDGGDRGDSYNYGPPAHDALIDERASVDVEVLESGPVRGALLVTRTYDLPVGLVDGDPDRRCDETVAMPVAARVELRMGEPFVRVEVSLVNPARNHRLRWHVPLPEPVTESHAEGQYAVTTRGLAAEGGWGEFPLPTFPASSFVNAGPATVLLDHVTEYELVDGGRELALTLLRSVGMMSVNVHPLRDEPAGSEFEVPGAQYVGVPVTARLAILVHAGGWVAGAGNAPQWAEWFRSDALVAPGSAAYGSDLPDTTTGLEITGSGVVTTAIRPRDIGTEIRIVALSPTATGAVVTGPFSTARRTDLLGRDLGGVDVVDGALTLDLAPWEIATIRVS